MKVEIWDGGLQEQEITAIEKIQQTFAVKPVQANANARGGSIQDQMRGLGLAQQPSGMFPWKGYAGFRFVDSKNHDGEFDLVIVTHCNVIIVELKDWNHEPITAKNDRWFKGNKDMSRSPVSTTRNKKFTLENKIKKIAKRFTNSKFPPHVHFFVVMTGNADFSKLPEVDLNHTMSLTDFLKLADEKTFNRRFTPHPNSKGLQADIGLFDEMFLGPQTAPKALRINGYSATEIFFEHPRKIYKEYLATAENSASTQALLRAWDFNHLDGHKSKTLDGRAEIVSREREVLQHINHQNRELYNHCLRSLTSFQRDEVTTHYYEIYELPPGHVRFNEFIGRYGIGLAEGDRLNVAKLLIAKFADLHEIKIAHRDIADHSLWISHAKEVSLSNFISAYHQPIGTVGDYRTALSVGAVEAKDMLGDGNYSPFQQDVHALGLVVWHLLNGKRMSPKSLESVKDEILSSDKWYAPVVLSAISASFGSAREFFAAIKREEPSGISIPTFDSSELDPYRHPINHSRQFKEDGDLLIGTEEKEVYISDGKLVKAWLNMGVRGDDPVTDFQVLRFLKQLSKLASIRPAFLPEIFEFGIATKSSSVYLVSAFIDGLAWSDYQCADFEAKLSLIHSLVSAVEQLHHLGVSHGDLHPGNVMIESGTNLLFIIDIPDFNQAGEEQKNHAYSPEYIDTCSALERDIYAVIKMSCELVSDEKDRNPAFYSALLEVSEVEAKDRQFGFKSLDRFRKALEQSSASSADQLIEIVTNKLDEPFTLYPDNGHLYVAVEPHKSEPSKLTVTFYGIGGVLKVVYNRSEKAVVYVAHSFKRSSISPRDIDSSQFEINVPIKVVSGRTTVLEPLTSYLNAHEAFTRTIALMRGNNEQPAAPDDVLTSQLFEAFRLLEAKESVVSETNKLSIPTKKLWQAILETETESSPCIRVDGEISRVDSKSSEILIPYSADIDPLGEFSAGDEVTASIIDRDDAERIIGEVSLKNSALKEIRLMKPKALAFSLKENDIVYFRSKQDRSSFRKRRKALERILERESVIPNLQDYFDPSCEYDAVDYGISISEEEFSRYDREDGHGGIISLNKQQRDALRILVSRGPVSLLQGPPGTGKTEFISAFVHYLIESQNAKRILLVSQSHEAVNTAAERIRKHCARLNTDIEVVRFSNREGAVSQALKDIYSNSITTEKRELFNAEVKYRVELLKDALGLDAEFISAVVLAELQLFRQIDDLVALFNQIDESKDENDKVALKRIVVGLDDTIRTKLSEVYSIQLSADSRVSDAKTYVLSKLCADYAVRPDEALKVRALAKICRDMQEAIAGERVNLDEFYARSRQLVVGTCVGIGQGHIGISENIYDWVIIDEAARSIASELAIAMQSGQRVLLVGDHLQLPPLYSDAHKDALALRLGIKNSKAELDEVLQSDFARAFESKYGAQASAALLTQYRMAPAIGTLVSETFYKKRKLVNGNRTIPNIYENAPEALQNYVTWLDTSSLGGRSYHLESKGSSIYNRVEADQILLVLKQIAENTEFVTGLSAVTKKDEAAIGIICMYAEQKRIIRQKFNQESWSDGFKELVKIDTVDSYQGKENRIIILSLTRSDKHHSPGFLRMPNRINVAMSRAMDRLLIVGNSDMWQGRNKELPLGEVVQFMQEHGTGSGYSFLQVKAGK